MIEILREILNPVIYPVVQSDYIYNGHTVPRVTAILSDMLHEDGLMSWSNFIGLVKHQKYKDVLNEAAEKGTYVHNSIEAFLQEGKPINSVDIPDNIRREVMTAWESFTTWWNVVMSHGNIKILAQEQPLISEFFGGTLDLLLEVDGKVHLIDFKTSNHITYKYLIQLAAYRYMLASMGINVDYIGVIRLDKREVFFEEMILDMNDEADRELIDLCTTCFMSLVAGYFTRAEIEARFKERKKIID